LPTRQHHSLKFIYFWYLRSKVTVNPEFPVRLLFGNRYRELGELQKDVLRPAAVMNLKVLTFFW
jgi:hypothetical protein